MQTPTILAGRDHGFDGLPLKKSFTMIQSYGASMRPSTWAQAKLHAPGASRT